MIIVCQIMKSVHGKGGYCLGPALNSLIIYKQVRPSPSGIIKLDFLSLIEFIICRNNATMYEVQCLAEFKLLFE